MDWLSENGPWLFAVLLSAYEAYQLRKGSKAKKAFAAAKVVHEAAKKQHWDDTLKELRKETDKADLMVPTWQAKLEEAEANMLSLRPKK